jgi:hypothetical protein
MRGAVPPLPEYVFMARCFVKQLMCLRGMTTFTVCDILNEIQQHILLRDVVYSDKHTYRRQSHIRELLELTCRELLHAS